MSRYSKYEHDKIEYLKYRIKELRFLHKEQNILSEELFKIDQDLKKIPSPSLNKRYKSKYEYKNNYALWNKLISERDDIINKINNVESVIEDINMILDALTPISKDLAVDLLVKKKGVKWVEEEYHTRNAYQTLNDELKYFDIDSFLSHISW